MLKTGFSMAFQPAQPPFPQRQAAFLPSALGVSIVRFPLENSLHAYSVLHLQIIGFRTDENQTMAILKWFRGASIFIARLTFADPPHSQSDVFLPAAPGQY